MRCPVVILEALSLILLVVVQADDTMNSLEKRGSRRYCGETLNNMLMFLCDSVYAKRSDTDMMNWQPSEPIVTPYIYAERSYFPFKSRDNAVSLIPRQDKRQGVVDECCRKPCTLAELSSYCGVKSR